MIYFPEIDYFIVKDFAKLVNEGWRSWSNVPNQIKPFVKLEIEKLANK